MDVTRSYEFIWFGDMHGPKTYKFIGFRRASISQTPVFFIVPRGREEWEGSEGPSALEETQRKVARGIFRGIP
jgi:hypothetical protein